MKILVGILVIWCLVSLLISSLPITETEKEKMTLQAVPYFLAALAWMAVIWLVNTFFG